MKGNPARRVKTTHVLFKDAKHVSSKHFPLPAVPDAVRADGEQMHRLVGRVDLSHAHVRHVGQPELVCVEVACKATDATGERANSGENVRRVEDRERESQRKSGSGSQYREIAS